MSLVTYWRTRTLLLAGGVVSCALAATLFAALGLPAPGSPSPVLLTQPSPAVLLGLVAVLLAVSATVGTLIGGRIRPDAGLLAAAMALVAVSWSTGGVRHLIFALPPDRNPFLWMAVETVVLAVLMGAVQVALHGLVARGVLLDDGQRDGVPSPSATAGENVLALLCTAGAFVLLAFFFLPTDLKKQALFGVGFAAAFAAIAVHYIIAPRAASWPFWCGILLGGLAVYLYAASGFRPGGAVSIGYIELAPARAAPIDLAGAGVAGALIGYWYSRRWKRPTPEHEPA
ncbi:MAG: hypothetical protein ACK4PI_04220 [Tepidisphaerales bacterium]